MVLIGTVKILGISIMRNCERITRKMLSVIREGNERTSNKTLLNENSENNHMSNNDEISITKNTPQFGDVRVSQEDMLKKTLNVDVKFDDDALIYYGESENLVFQGTIPSLSLYFQFKYIDPSGDGCYIFTKDNYLQLTDTNYRTIGKIRDAFINWKNALVQDGDLMMKLKQSVTKEK